MLGRRHYRIKVFQALYGWFQGAETNSPKGEKNLLQSINNLYELYYIQLSFLLEVMDFYRRKMEDARHKFLPTEEDVNPNTRLLSNLVLEILRSNKELQRKVLNYKISWTDEQEMLRKIHLKIRNSKDLKDYLSLPAPSFEDEKEIVYKLFKKIIIRSGDLRFYCEERNIFWADDFQSAALLVLKTIRQVPSDLPPEADLLTLFEKDENDDPEDDHRFIVDLFHKTINQSQDFEVMIDSKTRNWEIDRIALTDIILIKMALVELLHFPNIPVKVTLNEYIELSKLFSTPKSQMFVNGLLDKLVEDLKTEKKIKKMGRGLR